MRIAHLSTERTWRGGEAQILALALGSRLRGMDVVVIAPPDAPLAVRAQQADLPVATVAVRSPLNFLATRRLMAAVERIGPTILHVHDGHGLLHGKRVVRRTAVPYFIVHRRVPFKISSARKYSYEIDHIICISNDVRDVMLYGGVPASLMSVIYDGVEAPAETSPAESAPPGLDTDLHDRFSVERMVDETLALYRKIVFKG